MTLQTTNVDAAPLNSCFLSQLGSLRSLQSASGLGGGWLTGDGLRWNGLLLPLVVFLGGWPEILQMVAEKDSGKDQDCPRSTEA